MSLATWRKEFYSTSACACKGNAIQHSLRKWRGLTKENLKKHGLRREGNEIFEADAADDVRGFWIDDKSCALCRRYFSDRCADCPLQNFLGRRCDDIEEEHMENKLPAYSSFLVKGNPNPMIRLLEKAQEFVRLPANRKRWPKEVKK